MSNLMTIENVISLNDEQILKVVNSLVKVSIEDEKRIAELEAELKEAKRDFELAKEFNAANSKELELTSTQLKEGDEMHYSLCLLHVDVLKQLNEANAAILLWIPINSPPGRVIIGKTFLVWDGTEVRAECEYLKHVGRFTCCEEIIHNATHWMEIETP